MTMTGKIIRKTLRYIAYIALICLLCAGCGKVKEPVTHISVVPPLEAQTSAAETETSEATEEAAAPETEAAEPETESTAPETEVVAETEPAEAAAPVVQSAAIAEDGVYTTAADVAAYINTYGKLPGNFITKKQAEKLGWQGGSLEPYAPGMCIGGDYFGNYEGLLPTKSGREYHECDIDTLGKSKRGAKRIIYSNDGLIYYTGDHYASFTLLYGTE